MGIRENLKRGTIEMLILYLLKEEDKYGYQLTQEFKDKSQGQFLIHDGSMYPTLYRLIEKGMVSDHKEIVGKRRQRVYYHLEPAGIEYLEQIITEYENITAGIARIMGKK